MDAIEGESFFGWSFADPLIYWDENFDFAPSIAESWEISEDGLTWTFHIREGVKFHNGDPLTSADCQFSVEHWQSPDSWNPWSPYLRNNKKSIETPDKYTVIYRSLKPEPNLIVPFTATRVLPKKLVEKVGEKEFFKKPIGSGPWKFGLGV